MPTSKAGSSECFFCLSFFTQPISRIWPNSTPANSLADLKTTLPVTNYPKLLLWIPITKHCYPLLFPHFILLEVRQEGGCESSRCSFSSHCVWKSINVCLVERHVSNKMQWSEREREREWGGGTDCEKKSFSSHLSTLNLSSCWAPDWLGADLHTQTRTKSSSACWLNQASLQSLSCTQPHTHTHTHTHTPATITHSLNIPDGAFIHTVKVGGCCWAMSIMDHFQLCFSSWASWVCTR